MKKELSTIPAMLAECCRKFARKPAMILSNGSAISYKDMNWDISRTLGVLRKAGVAKKSKVLLFAENSPQAVETYFAVTKMGAVAVLLASDVSTEQVAEVLATESPDAVFVSEATRALLPESVEATVFDVCDNRILRSAKKPISFILGGVFGADLATVVFQSDSAGALVRTAYTQKQIADSVKAAAKAKKAVGSAANPLASIIDYARAVIFPLLSGRGSSVFSL